MTFSISNKPINYIKMKNRSSFFSVTVLVFGFLAFVLCPDSAYSQKKTQQETLAAFPNSVSGIFKNSCVGCHSDQSNSKAKMFLNLSEWDKLKMKKQVKIGKKMNKEVANGTMPPEGFLKKRPEAALTPDQIKSISVWSKSIRSNAKN
jgi:cytochrome c5